MKIAADAPLRWKLFNLNVDNRQAGDAIDYCVCGTRGGCEVCASISEWLYMRWLATLHPFRYFWQVKILGRPW